VGCWEIHIVYTIGSHLVVRLSASRTDPALISGNVVLVFLLLELDLIMFSAKVPVVEQSFRHLVTDLT
jgi:hypothetical protein